MFRANQVAGSSLVFFCCCYLILILLFHGCGIHVFPWFVHSFCSGQHSSLFVQGFLVSVVTQCLFLDMFMSLNLLPSLSFQHWVLLRSQYTVPCSSVSVLPLQDQTLLATKLLLLLVLLLETRLLLNLVSTIIFSSFIILLKLKFYHATMDTRTARQQPCMQ